MKQFKMQAAHMACMFFSVDDDAGKILCMSCVPEVCAITVVIVLSVCYKRHSLYNSTQVVINFWTIWLSYESAYRQQLTHIIIIIIIRHAPCQCVGPLATNSLHSDLSKASSIASSKVRLCRDRSLFKVAIQYIIT